MEEVDSRLVRCFRAVFRTLDESSARQATRSRMEEDWDSLASVVLLQAIEQEFGVTIDLFDLDELDSFAALKRYLTEGKADSSRASDQIR